MANEIGVTEVTAVAQDLIASVVQDVLKQKSVLLPTIMDYSAFATAGAKSVAIPKRAQFASANKAENTDLTAQEMLFTADKIDLNKHKAIYAKLERIAGIESNVNVQNEILVEMANELALQVDKDIIVQLKLASAVAPDHILDYVDSIGNVIAQSDILNARMLLNIQKVGMQDRFMVISPLKEREMLSIADFVRADAYGSAQGLINGELGRIYGFTVLMHTELGVNDSLFYHKSSCAFARQLSTEYATNFELKSVSQEYLLHHLYGTKVLDAGVRQVYYNGTGA